ncbi:MAG: CRISPR-associated protein Csx19 [Chloroflexota bacterium]
MTNWQRNRQDDIQAQITINYTDDPFQWLLDNCHVGDKVLAHALDGIIWGFVDTDKNIVISSGTFEERRPFIQQIRIFNKDNEYYAWQYDNRWMVRKIADGDGENRIYFDEPHILYGTSNHDLDNGFIEMTQGEEGLIHTPPISLATDTINIESEANRRLCLNIRNYLGINTDTSMTVIAASRLVSIETKTFLEEKTHA